MASVTADIAGKIKITKFDKADAAVKLAGVVFEIIRKSDGVKVQEVTTDGTGLPFQIILTTVSILLKKKTPKIRLSGKIVKNLKWRWKVEKVFPQHL